MARLPAWGSRLREEMVSGSPMFKLLKQLFVKKHQADSMFPRNRFEHVDWEQELADAARRLVNDDGHYDEQGKTVELELSEGAHNILLYFASGDEAQYMEILQNLNAWDNQVQASLEKEAQSPIPRAYQEIGYNRQSWKKVRQFHVWIVNCEEKPYSIHYVADHVNNEFVIYLAQENGVWQAFWDSKLQKSISK